MRVERRGCLLRGVALGTALSLLLSSPGPIAYRAFAETVINPSAARIRIPGVFSSRWPVGREALGAGLASLFRPSLLSLDRPAQLGSTGMVLVPGASASPAEAVSLPVSAVAAVRSVQSMLTPEHDGLRPLSLSGVGLGSANRVMPNARSFAQPRESPLLKALISPSFVGRMTHNAPVEQVALAAEADFLTHMGGATLSTFADPAGYPRNNRLRSLNRRAEGSLDALRPDVPRARSKPAERQNRSALFAVVLAAIAGASWFMATAVPLAIQWISAHFSHAAYAPEFAPLPEAGISLKTAIFAIATGALAVLAIWDLALFWFTMWRGVGVTDREYYDYARTRLNRMGLHPSVISVLIGRKPGRGVLKLDRHPRSFWDFYWGFRQGRSIYARPEMVRLPRWIRGFIFDQWIKHELTHFSADFGRSPPAVQPSFWIVRFWRWLKSEIRAYFFGELRSRKSMRSVRMPVLDRVLYDAQVSLKLKAPYDLLIVHPSSTEEMLDPAQYVALSDGRARVIGLQTYSDSGSQPAYLELEGAALTPAGPRGPPAGQPPTAVALADYLSLESNRGRFKRIVFPQSFDAIPPSGSSEERRLRRALKQLDDVYLLSQRLRITGQALGEHSLEAREFERLTGMVAKMRRRGQINSKKFEAILAQLVLHISRTQLQGIGLARAVESLYAGLRHKGVAMLPFSHSDPGLDTIEKLLKYWRGKDGGGFHLERVDLAEGGHVLVARKMEPRVNLWLKPVAGRRIATSDVDVLDSQQVQEAVLRNAGFGDAEIQRFRGAGMEVQFVFGEDFFGEHGGNRLFVSVPRINAKMLKRYGEESGFQFHASRGGIEHHLLDSGPMHHMPAVWKLGRRGKGMLVGHVDTGVDAVHPDFRTGQIEQDDVTGEGLEDWDEHGSHTAGDSYADGYVKGPAPAASGINVKVFPRGTGTSDGYIMAGWVKLMQKGAHVISSSLGSPGLVNSPLAKAASELTQKKNSKGLKPVMVASRGNSGPVNESMSQPSSGEYVNSTASYTKKKRVSFFSSVAPALDDSFSLEFIRFPFGIGGVGGNVRTLPGQKDVYDEGVLSVKSQYGQPSPSDTPDHKRRRMSGTSMIAPQIAGIAADVEEELLSIVKPGHPAYDFVMENLPYVVNMMLFSSAENRGVPIWFDDTGFVDAEAAVKLVRSTFGNPSASKTKAWDWIERTQKVYAATRDVFEKAEAVKQEKIEKLNKRLAQRQAELKSLAEAGDKEASKVFQDLKSKIGSRARLALEKRFAEGRKSVVGELLRALKDEAWMVRYYAAFAFINLKDPDPQTLNALAEAALNDPDGRVRQAAFFAIARTPAYSVDELLHNAAQGHEADVAIYAAHALARHGELSGVARILQEAQAKDGDESVRYSATWLLGQLGRRAPKEVSKTLIMRVQDEAEIDEIRHLAVISLSEMALASPAAITDDVVLGLLSSAGPQTNKENFAMTRTISKFFVAAVRSRELRNRLRSEPLKGAIADFVHTYKSYVNKPGIMGQFVAFLARLIDLPLDLPTPVPNPEGVGVPGVDPNLGEIHLIVELPKDQGGAEKIERFQDFRGAGLRTLEEAAVSFGLGPETMARHHASLQAAMPTNQSLWVNIPDSKVLAFSAELEARGYQVHRARPVYAHIHEVGPLLKMPQIRQAHGLTGKGVVLIYPDEGGDPSHPAFRPGQILSQRNFTDDGGVEEVDRESVGHGTHGMGIVGGNSVEGSPYVGMAPDVRFIVAKMLGANGGSEAQAMAALEWGVSQAPDPHKAPVGINASWGGPGPVDNPLNRLVTQLKLKNYQFIAAAGNEGPGEDTVSSPANAPLAKAIGAVAKDGNLVLYSSRSTPEKLEIARVNYGGSVNFNHPNPYEIISALSTRLAEAMEKAPTTVYWPERNGKPLYQYMSGTSMAGPAEWGVQAVLAQRAAEVLIPALGVWPDGIWDWLDQLVSAEADPMPEHAAYEVGAGRTNPEKALAALNEALKNPQRVAAEAEALARDARAKHGKTPLKPPGRGWFRRLIPLQAAAVWWSLILPAAVFSFISICWQRLVFSFPSSLKNT